MWSRLDDALIDHEKVSIAGELLGENGRAIVIGFYAVGLMWTNKHLTDGVLSLAVVKGFPHVTDPLSVADALVKAGLWDKNGNGFHIHDFSDFNPSAAAVKRKRKEDRVRKREKTA